MDPARHKVYLIEKLDTGKFVDKFFDIEPSNEKDSFALPIEKFHNFLKFDKNEGALIDFSPGPVLAQLYSTSNSFNEIVPLRYDDESITEINKWLRNDPGARNWKHVSQCIADLERKSAKAEDIEKRLKAVLKPPLKLNTNKDNITDPVQLPPADYIIIGLILDLISINKDDFIKNFKQFSALLKPGGKLLYFGLLDATYFNVFGEKFHLLQYNKEFLITTLEGEGYDIYHYDIQRRETQSDLGDFKAFIFVAAQKKP